MAIIKLTKDNFGKYGEFLDLEHNIKKEISYCQ